MANHRPLNHQQTEQLLSVYRELTDQEKTAVAAHLATCQSCSDFAQTSQQMDRLLKQSQQRRPDPRVAETFYSTIENDSRSWFRTFTQFGGQLAGIAVLLVVVFGAWLLFRSGPVQTPVEPTSIITTTPTSIGPEVLPTDLEPLYTLTQTVSLFALSPESSYLVAGKNNDYSIWNAEKGEWLNYLKLNTDPLVSMAFTPNGVNLIGQDQNGQFHRWIAFNGSYQRSFTGPIAPLGTPFALGNTSLILVNADKDVEIWSLVGSEPTYTLQLSGDPIADLAISTDGQLIAIIYQDGTVLLWKDNGKKFEEVLNGISSSRGLVFTHDGRQYVTYQDTTFQFWREGTITYQLAAQHDTYGTIESVQFASQNQFLMVNYSGGYIEIWDFNTGQLVKTFQSQPAVQSVTGLTRDAFIQATLDTQNRLTIWGKPEE